MSSGPNLNHMNRKTLNTSNRLDIHSFRKTISILEFIIDALGEFKGHYEKRFNFSKLAELLGIPKSDIDDVFSLILKFQDKFDTVFKDYYLRKSNVGNKIYFTLEKKPAPIPKEVKVSKNQAKLLSDVIYLFKFVNKGKGFDLKKNGTDLLRHLKGLTEEHPYLFTQKSNKLTYPTELGLELGNIILSYNKSNKKIETLKINDCNIVVE